MQLSLKILTRPEQPTGLVARAYQVGNTLIGEVEVPDAPADVTVEMTIPGFDATGLPLVGIELLQVEDLAPIRDNGDVAGWPTLASRASIVVDAHVASGQTKEMGDPANWYKPVCKIIPTFSRPDSASRATGNTGPLLKAAQKERLAYNRIVDNAKPLVNAVKIMFLRRFRANVGELPASYFCMLGMNDAPTSEAVLAQLLEKAAHIHGWSLAAVFLQLKDFHAGQDVPDLPGLLKIVGEMLVMPATANYYHGDHSLKTIVDRFQSSIFQNLGQADCEDVAKDVHYFATQSQKLVVPQTNPLYYLVWLLNQYVFTMVTGVATSPKLQRPNANDTGSDPADYICHVWAMAIPALCVRQWKVAGGTIQGEARSQAADTAQMRRLIDIGALTLEATNFTTALHRPLPRYYPEGEARDIAEHGVWATAAARRQVAKRHGALGEMAYSLPATCTMQEPKTLGDQSRFYRWVVSMWLHPADDAEPIDYTIFAPTHPGKFGVSFGEFLSLPKRAFLRPNFKRRVTSRDIMYLLAQEPPQQPLVVHRAAELTSFSASAPDLPEGANTSPRTVPWMCYRAQHLNELTDEVRADIKALGGHVRIVRITDKFQIIIITIPLPLVIDPPEFAFVQKTIP